MGVIAILGLVLIILGILHYVPLILGLILGMVLIIVGSSTFWGPWNRPR